MCKQYNNSRKGKGKDIHRSSRKQCKGVELTLINIPIRRNLSKEQKKEQKESSWRAVSSPNSLGGEWNKSSVQDKVVSLCLLVKNIINISLYFMAFILETKAALGIKIPCSDQQINGYDSHNSIESWITAIFLY